MQKSWERIAESAIPIEWDILGLMEYHRIIVSDMKLSRWGQNRFQPTSGSMWYFIQL